MRYVEARIEDASREEAYRIYVTRSLQLAPQSKYINQAYSDFVSPKKPLEEKNGEQIVSEVMKNAGLRFGDKT